MLFRRTAASISLVIVASLILIGTALGSGDDKVVNLSSLSDTDLRNATVRFDRIGCYGSCPAYTVTVHGDGHVEYVGKNHVKVKGPQEGQVEIAKVRNLLSEFASRYGNCCHRAERDGCDPRREALLRMRKCAEGSV